VSAEGCTPTSLSSHGFGGNRILTWNVKAREERSLTLRKKRPGALMGNDMTQMGERLRS